MNKITFKQNRTVDASRLPSPVIWSDCPWHEIMDRQVNGVAFYDDFQDFPLAGTQTTQIGHGRYKVFNTGAAKITRVSTINSVEIGGAALETALDTDNDSGSIGHSYPQYLLSGLNSNSGKLWFECCYGQNSIVTNFASVFMGLAEVDQFTFATAVPLNGGDAITNGGSILGFRIAEDGLGVIDTVVSDRATSFTNIGAGEGGTLAAYTFKKLGLVYDPTGPAARRIVFYADNLELTTPYSHASLIATTNLDANALGLIFSACADSAGTTYTGWMKWWRVAQLLP